MSERLCRLCRDPLPANASRDRAYCGPCTIATRSQGPSTQFADSSNIIATETLHRRMWAVYERIAKERRLPHPLVAAVQLGMAA